MEDVAAREALEDPVQVAERRRPFFLRYLRARSGAALMIWRLEAYLATPLALLFLATLGRWPGALAMGSVMAAFAAVFLFLLHEDPALEDVRSWLERRRLGRALARLADRRDGRARLWRALALVPAVMVLGPFWRAVTFNLFRMRRLPAYVLSVGGSIPHALLWTGLVLGGIWEGLLWPWIREL